MSPTRRNTLLLLVCLAWGSAVAAGLAALHRYEATPGRAAASPQRWPTPSHVALDTNRHTLVIFIHPQCPCSAASIEQLDRMVAQCGDRLSVYVIAAIPQGAPAGFENSRTLNAAAGIPGVRLLADPGNHEATRFGAETSGHVLLYEPGGRLKFSGGITAGRGHAGDNAASDAVLAMVTGRAPAPVDAAPMPGLLNRSPVYGCSLSGAITPPPPAVSGGDK
jgi:hypothetical protein